jgi:lantibiotic modifying enzyme
MAADFSALGAAGVQRGVVPRPAWEAANTDAMVIRMDVGLQRHHQHLPAAEVRLEEHAADVERGFLRAWRVIAQNRDSFPLSAFDGCRVRFLLRNTLSHFLTMREAARPPHLADGVEHSIRLDWLARLYLGSTERTAPLPLEGAKGCERPPEGEGARPRHWPLLRAEHDALERLDIPRFTADADGEDLYADPVVAPGSVESGQARAAARLRRLDDRARQTQLGYLRTSLGEPTRPGRVGTARAPLDIAWDIYRDLRDRALITADAAVWIDAAPQAPSGARTMDGPARIAPLPLDLYAGQCGVALFLCGLAQATADRSVRRLALAAFATPRLALDTRLLLGLPEGIGLGGVGGYVLALARGARLLDCPALLDDAREWAACLTPERLAGASSPDVLGGVAGALLGLSELGIGDLGAGSQRLREAIGRPPAPGFGHGSAGIAAALQACGEAASWAPDPGAEGLSWCVGLGGDALVARETHPRLLEEGETVDDSLCCGTAGLIDALLVRGRTDPRCLERARVLVERLARADAWRVQGPSLFRGSAGIGWVMLRATFPHLKNVSCVPEEVPNSPAKD